MNLAKHVLGNEGGCPHNYGRSPESNRGRLLLFNKTNEVTNTQIEKKKKLLTK